MTGIDQGDADTFIAKWRGVTASELSTARSFALDLCKLLGVQAPHPDAEQQYMFERPVPFSHGNGSSSAGRTNLYKRGCFVLEAKKLKAPTHTKGFDDVPLRARSQAEQYARALPASEGRPPFLIVPAAPGKRRPPQLLDMLEALGRAREQDGRFISL